MLLPGIDYFQIVFTLPQQFSSLVLGNRRQLYGLLMRAAWWALDELMQETFGIQSAATLVLHTWNQRLGHHPHVHALVPGGGPTLDGERWVTTHHKRHRRRKKPYLIDNIELGKRFRQQFIKGLKRIHRRGELALCDDWSHLQDSAKLEKFVEAIVPGGWNVFIEAPPTKSARPENVLKYLARYMSGGPISDRRLIADDGDVIKFWARSVEKPKSGERSEQVVEELPSVEFTRRWALHILPKGFMKVRSYGGYWNGRRADYLKRCCELLDVRPPCEASEESEAEVEATDLKPQFAQLLPKCPVCQQAMWCIEASDRPSWSTTMNGPYRPRWYEQP